MVSSLQVVPQGRTARVTRRPQHTFNVGVTPFAITPFFIAPVLPGETMKNLLFQARVVTAPIKDPLVGWWAEFYFWYIKHRDFNEPLRTNLVNMMIDPSVTAPVVGADPGVYRFANGVDYAGAALIRCVETYFRDTGEAFNVAMVGSYPAAQITQQTVLDSALTDAAYLAGSADDLVVGADDTVTGAELSQSWILWQQYRAANITHLSYEEYLHTYGIPLPAGSEGSHRPELVRYVKSWSYPVNTVDPITGAPSSALSWAIAERADKDRFFREPGFLFGCVCIRPKVYLSAQSGTVTGAMKDALSWLPAVMGMNPEYSVRKFTALTGPFSTVTADYRLDLKDLFLYGEQWTNRGASVPNKVALPSATLGKKYPVQADIDGMFKTAGGQAMIDGVVSLNILGMQTDTTPTRAPGTF
jgi:hypothetical protein